MNPLRHDAPGSDRVVATVTVSPQPTAVPLQVAATAVSTPGEAAPRPLAALSSLRYFRAVERASVRQGVDQP